MCCLEEFQLPKSNVIIYRTPHQGADNTHFIAEALGKMGYRGITISLFPDEELSSLNDEILAEMGLQRIPGYRRRRHSTPKFIPA